MERAEREEIAARRLLSVVERHGAAIPRTLEQKISDAGPNPLRVDPHILTPVRNRLLQEGKLTATRRHNQLWYHLPSTSDTVVESRIAEQFEALRLTLDNAFKNRVGDALEIAVQRGLMESPVDFLGGFRGLTEAPTTSRLRKEEPPSIFNGRELAGNKRFDFLAGGPVWCGIECKNVREWLYPDRKEVQDLLNKSLEQDVVPVLVARRIPFVTRRVLQRCGMLVWETRHQFYPPEYDNIAAQVKEKTSLGYFDIRVTDAPTTQLMDFLVRILPEELPAARERFEQHKDLLSAYAGREMSYKSFAARVRRRQDGENEDRDPEPEDENGEVDAAPD